MHVSKYYRLLQDVLDCMDETIPAWVGQSHQVLHAVCPDTVVSASEHQLKGHVHINSKGHVHIRSWPIVNQHFSVLERLRWASGLRSSAELVAKGCCSSSRGMSSVEDVCVCRGDKDGGASGRQGSLHHPPGWAGADGLGHRRSGGIACAPPSRPLQVRPPFPCSMSLLHCHPLATPCKF